MDIRDRLVEEATLSTQKTERHEIDTLPPIEINKCEIVLKSMVLDRNSTVIDRERHLFIRNRGRRTLSRSSSIF